MTRCHRCGGAADALRASARIIDGAVVSVCAASAGAPARAHDSEATLAWCASCGLGVPVADAVPLVRDGQVVQQCPDCASGRRCVVAVVDSAPPVSARRGRAPLFAFAAALLAFVAAPTFIDHHSCPLDLVTGDGDPAARDVRAQVTPTDLPLRYQAYMASDPRPVKWVHPLAGDLRLPYSPSRRFGALRERPDTRPECGRGHCGVDLGHRRGEVIHAAADGIVDRIVRDDRDIGGRYVRVRHSQGYTTFYMHLGRIHPALHVGQRVDAGDPLARMGTSGIKRSAPHLHFALRETLDHGKELFIDPVPMLRKARVLAHEAPFPGPDQI